MASDAASASALVDIDPSRVHSARIVESNPEETAPDGERATEKDTVQLVLSLTREEAERLAQRLKNKSEDDQPGAASNLSAPSPSQETVSAGQERTGPATRLRTSSRTKATDAPVQATNNRTTRASASNTTNGTTPQQQPIPHPDVVSPPTAIELQGFIDTERSYTNAFHKTLSLFVDDKTFSTPSLRGAVVGFLESSNATVLETLPHHNHVVPDHLKQEIENHVNLVKTVLQRGGVFAEDFLRTRLKKLAAHIPRIEAAVNGRSGKSAATAKAPVLLPRSNDPYNSARELSPGTAAANQAALAQAAEAAARANNRHNEMINASIASTPTGSNPDEVMMGMNGFGPNGPPPLPLPAVPGQLPPGQIAIQPQQLPPMRNKTFVPPNLVPSQAGNGQRPEEGGGSPPPILAPFDPRPNPMACLFCRQRKIRCIGHKPHPCEICVKRGYVCSYDWISRRGKRKPKNPDGTPVEIPAGSVSLAVSTDSMGHTVGGVPVVVPPTVPPGPHVGAPPPPAVGMHPNPALHPAMHAIPAMPPGMPGQPGPDGSVPQFAFTFIPGHPATFPPPGHLPPGVAPPPQPIPPLPEGQPRSPAHAQPTAAQPTQGEDTAMIIDPSLINGAGGGGNAGDATVVTCRFCKEQDLECGGRPPETCVNCARRDLACHYDDEPATKAGKRKGGAQNAEARANGSSKKKKRAGDAAGDASANKKQKVAPVEQAANNEHGINDKNEHGANGDITGSGEMNVDSRSPADSAAAVDAEGEDASPPPATVGATA
ncbi:hypothetical protein FRB99_001143 [Tulasnella sp. 403]|nr:hypothetical protein FRB99_001143 [Tulasnella sp. 403]